MDEITQAARAWAKENGFIMNGVEKLFFAAGYTAGLDRAAKVADDEGCGRSECRECVGQRVASKIRTLAHPPKED